MYNRAALSVITPVLNAIDTLPECLASVERYLGATCEHIVVDGGSTDGCWELLQANVFVTAFKQRSAGLSAALNEALEKATGRYIVVLNADDYFVEQIREVLDWLTRDPAPGAVLYTDITQQDPLTGRSIICHADIAQAAKYMSVYHSGLFVPRKVYAEVGRYRDDYKLAMDSNWVHRCLAAEVNFVKLSVNACTMRLRGRSHLYTFAAMREFERSVVETNLRGPVVARLFRIRQTIFHTLFKAELIQRIWLRLSRGSNGYTR